MRSFNFSAGPAILPESVIKNAQQMLWDAKDSGIGILEHSHRGKVFVDILAETKANIRTLASVPDEYEILFLQGGASSQFFMLPMNFLKGGTADYINTGTWSKKAIKEAQKFGTVNVPSTGEHNGFTEVPTKHKFSSNPVYVHFTSNNTIAGTEFHAEPEAPSGAWLACDASSDIFSRKIDISKYGMVYAGAQKNLGPSGVTLVIIRKDLVETGAEDLPTMLQYRTHVAKDSAFNTPPTFGIYIIGEVVKWLLSSGGLTHIESYNKNKADLLYNYVDSSDLFYGTAKEGSRSLMNVCFRCKDETKEAEFIAAAAKEGLVNLKGHRSVGGMRASIYNAFPVAGVEALVAFMKKFEGRV